MQEQTISIEEFDLPKTIINRVLKSGLPEGALFQKEAKTAFSKSGTVFVNFITTLALDLAKQSNVKTISPEMIFKALETADFDHYIPRIKSSIETHKESLKVKRSKKSDSTKSGLEEDSNLDDSMSNIIPETPLDSNSNNDEDSVIVQK